MSDLPRNPSAENAAPKGPIVHDPAHVAAGADKYNLLVITEPTWVGVVLEDEYGAPQEGVRCRITPGRGEPQLGPLDKQGLFRLEGKFREAAHIVFPDIDQDDWEVLGAQSSATASPPEGVELPPVSRFQPLDLPKEHTVAERETLRIIADRYGVQDWKRIYLHESNAELRKRRTHPGALQPGDLLHIPAKREKEHSGAYKDTHRFRLKPRTEILSLVLKDDDCVPYAHKKYELAVDGQKFAGETDENGGLSHEVPLDAKRGELKAWIEDDPQAEPVTWPLNIAPKIPPVEEIRGLQMRLNRLGFEAGPVTGKMNEKTREALRAVQIYLEFEAPDGEPTPETLEGIRELEEALYEEPTAIAASDEPKEAR